ncbi:hypothetical protein CEK26_010135 [Fusarium fujikuroi]|nr:hypothetical protein CEK26_010135 [Fusarium fujikuroi]
MSGTIYNMPRLFRAVVYPRNTAIVREQDGDLCRVVWSSFDFKNLGEAIALLAAPCITLGPRPELRFNVSLLFLTTNSHVSLLQSLDVFVIMDVVEPPLSRSLMAILAGPHSLLLDPSVFGETWPNDHVYNQSKIHSLTLLYSRFVWALIIYH